jgi:hypothetical protein
VQIAKAMKARSLLHAYPEPIGALRIRWPLQSQEQEGLRSQG